MILEPQELKEFLEDKYDYYNQPRFIEDDPISIPHLFTKKEDIEISGFLAATISWGNRKAILNSSKKLLQWMDMDPYSYILNAQPSDLEVFRAFVHRTFNGKDCLYFIRALKYIYQNQGGLENLFSGEPSQNVKSWIIGFREGFFQLEPPGRTAKHIADPGKGASAKRINMFLRWMIRKDNRGVDFGIWKKASPSSLMCPLDVHTGTVARKLGLLVRKVNDWKAVEELTSQLREFDPADPVKYDFALFGLGIYERF
jgi:uncharacterized protein (TIGR02757 family)